MLLKKANELLSQNKLREAEFHYKTLLQTEPDNGDALFGLGKVALRLEQFDAAVYILQRACQHLPYVLEPLYALSDAFNAVNSPEDAQKVLEYATSIAADNPDTHYYLAQHYLNFGELDKAQATFEEALKIGIAPVTAYVLFELVQLGRFNKANNYIDQLHHFLTQTNNLRLKMVCYYALAKSYDKLDDTDQAFNYFVIANQQQHKLSEFNTEDLIGFYDQLIEYNNESVLNLAKLNKQYPVTPVFIIGMPRSGSTLLEQMLAGHSQWATLGEDSSISNKVVAFLEHKTGLRYPQCLTKLTTPLINQARAIYLDTLSSFEGNCAFVINKLPSNYQNLGLIYILFPDAKFINLTRNFHATAFSVFTNYFAENEPYFCDLNEFALYHQLYEKLMSHWQQFNRLAIYNLSYEQLIENPKDQLTALLSFTGCEFEHTCLDFYKNKSAVTTLSKHAIRQPVNNKSLDKWQRYEAPLLSLLSLPQTN
ncbi:sulfotransferase [Pseudoalteromonas sp. SIMBA_153]